jgi:hypothetical protein
MKNTLSFTRLNDHVTHKSGERKTVCVTACLTSFGVPVESFNYTGSLGDDRRPAILRRHGFAVRSRKSSLPKGATIGQARKAIQKLSDPAGTRYLVVVQGSGYCHAMVLGADGQTLVDTAPRERDRRKVHSVHAVWPNEQHVPKPRRRAPRRLTVTKKDF